MRVEQRREFASFDGCCHGEVHRIGFLLQAELKERTALLLSLDEATEFLGSITRVPQAKRAPILLMTEQRPAGESADLGKARLQVLRTQCAGNGRRFSGLFKAHNLPPLRSYRGVASIHCTLGPQVT